MTDTIHPEKMPLTSMDITAEKCDELRRCLAATFPEVMAEKKIDFDQLKRVLGDWVEPDRERFGLTWPGKAGCMKVIQAPSVGTLKPCREESVSWDTTENLFIEGDNLEVLKLLQKAYFGTVTMIYIDPPYNTGNEFIYPDKFSETLETYLEYTGQKDTEGRKFSTNSDTSGRFHSRWLNMMYPRLYLAKNLLKNDGILFVSIDNGELKNLKHLLDEIFGEENFLGTIVRATGQTTGQDSGGLGSSFDYILAYSKTPDVEVAGLPLSDEDAARFQDEDERGKYHYWQLRKTGSADRREDRPNMYFAVRAPDGSDIYPVGPGGYESRWRCGPETYPTLVQDDMIIWKQIDDGKGGLRWWPYVKYYLEGRTKRPSPLWTDIDGSKKATRDLRDLFQEKVFDNPKPVQMITRLMQITPNSENGIILDFFAGSGTTAQAVQDLNSKDGGKRKFVLVQLPETTGRSDYPTISSITKERIKRSGAIYQTGMVSADLGFRAFKLDSSCFAEWTTPEPTEDSNDLVLKLEKHAEHLKEAASTEDILFEILLKNGFPLTVAMQRIKVAGREIFIIADGALLICLDKHLTQEVIDAMADMEPSRVICLDAGFQGNDQLKANSVQTFKSRARNRETAIEFRTV